MLGLNYGPAVDPLTALAHPDRGAISVYARSRDYHDVIKGKLKEVAGFLAARAGADVKVFVDTAPVMEKPLAQAAGLGWQGKHSVLVSRALDPPGEPCDEVRAAQAGVAREDVAHATLRSAGPSWRNPSARLTSVAAMSSRPATSAIVRATRSTRWWPRALMCPVS